MCDFLDFKVSATWSVLYSTFVKPSTAYMNILYAQLWLMCFFYNVCEL